MTNSAAISAPLSWIVLGGAQGGTVLSVVIAPDPEQTAYAATEVGVYRAQLNTTHTVWQRLTELPGTPTALALSPDFSRDSTLLIGTTIGPMVSHDRGETFLSAVLPRSSTHVVTLALSPNFLQDGIAFAGTLEDGVLVSHDRGKSWAAWNFGLIELEIVSLALSPNFAHDETVLIGTASGLYYSYNGGRAWRELDFPPEAQPLLSLAFAPGVSNKALVYAGTESAGLYRAMDPFTHQSVLLSNSAVPDGGTDAVQAERWQSLSDELDAACINALAFAAHGSLYTATEKGIFVTHGDGKWQSVGDVPGALCLAVADTIGIAGVGYQGEPEISGLAVSTFAAAASVARPANHSVPE